MYKTIHELFPDKYEIYIEPFGGSFSVALKNTQIPPVEIYNDLEKNVYTLYKVLSDNTLFSTFKEKCDLTIFSEDLRSECKVQLLRDDISLIARAYCFFIVNRFSVNGNGGFSPNLSIRRGMAKSVSDFLSTVDGLENLHQRLSRTIILNHDANAVIAKYKDNPNVFMYCDPPYHWSTRSAARYAVDFDNKQQETLIELLGEAKCRILLSGYSCELYDKLLEIGYKKEKHTLKTKDTNNATVDKEECFWFNYN